MTARAADLTFTRDLLLGMLERSGRVLLSAVTVAEALGMDDTTLRTLGDEGDIDYVRKGKIARAYTIESVMDFIAKGGRACRPIGKRGPVSTPMTSKSTVVDFTARPAARPSARRTNSNAN